MADSKTVLEVAAAVADGTAIDWDTASSALVTEDDRALLAELQFIAGIADGRAAAADDHPLADRSRDTWGPLRIIEKVGGGTFGEVFRAWDTRLDREVALKILRRRQPGNGPRLDVIEEGRLLARVRHPNIVAVYGAERIDDQVGVWMEFVHGKTLEEELRERGTFDVDEVIAIGIQLADALAAAHRAGLVHRDVKAQNVIRNAEGQPVLTDFGAGCLLEDRPEPTTSELAGTPLCAAPEVLAGRPSTPQSDVYSLGVLLYHLLTGRYPVRGGSLAEIREAHAANRQTPIRAERTDLPDALAAIIDRALNVGSERRYAGAEALRAALRELQDARGAPALTPSPRRWQSVGIAAALILLASLGSLWTPRRPETPVIAVLPLKNLSVEANTSEFVDGLTDQIIRNLTDIDGLAVRSQTSSFAFKDKPRDLREVAQRLQANYVVEGSVLRSGDKLRVNAQLVRVVDDTSLWSGRFDRELKDIFDIQDEISRSIVNELRLKIGRGQRRYSTNPPTYDLYLRARARLDTNGGLNVREVEQVADLFEQVIAQDPEFTPAYAGVAEAWAKGSLSYGGAPPNDAYARMRPAAERALQLDPLLAEAHAAMGLVVARDLDWTGAERSFSRAIELNGNLPLSRTSYAASTLFPEGRLDEAMRQLSEALRADPESMYTLGELVYVQVSAGRYDEAIKGARRVLASRPDMGAVRGFLARALVQKGNTAEAFQVVESVGRGSDNIRGYAYAITGRRSEAQALAIANVGFPGRLAFIYAGLGDKDRTFEALNAMIADNDPRAPIYLTYPEFASMRSDPRFATLRAKLHLPPTK